MGRHILCLFSCHVNQPKDVLTAAFGTYFILRLFSPPSVGSHVNRSVILVKKNVDVILWRQTLRKLLRMIKTPVEYYAEKGLRLILLIIWGKLKYRINIVTFSHLILFNYDNKCGVNVGCNPTTRINKYYAYPFFKHLVLITYFWWSIYIFTVILPLMPNWICFGR